MQFAPALLYKNPAQAPALDASNLMQALQSEGSANPLLSFFDGKQSGFSNMDFSEIAKQIQSGSASLWDKAKDGLSPQGLKEMMPFLEDASPGMLKIGSAIAAYGAFSSGFDSPLKTALLAGGSYLLYSVASDNEKQNSLKLDAGAPSSPETQQAVMDMKSLKGAADTAADKASAVQSNEDSSSLISMPKLKP